MTLDMYSDKVAEASALIREFAKVDYFHYFARDPESSLEAFIAMLDQAEEKGRQSQAARIAELELQIVEVQAECIKRGADLLERQLAAPSAPAVEQQPVAVIQQINEVNRTAVVTVTASNHWNIDVAIGDRLYAAPQAAKATGTAVELPPLKSINSDAGFWQKVSNWAYSDEGDMMEIRAKKMTDYIDQKMRAYGQACAEAARQPAPVVAVKAWQECMFDNAEAGNQIGSPQRFMRQEIADLRAALAATAAPVLSDEQIFKIHDQTNDADSQILAFARAIIAATNRSQP